MKIAGPVGSKKKKSVSFANKEKSVSCGEITGYVGLKRGPIKSALKKSSSVEPITKKDNSKKVAPIRPTKNGPKEVMVTPELPRPRMPPTLKLVPRYFRDEKELDDGEKPEKREKPNRQRLFDGGDSKKSDVCDQGNTNNNLPNVDSTIGFSEVNL